MWRRVRIIFQIVSLLAIFIGMIFYPKWSVSTDPFSSFLLLFRKTLIAGFIIILLTILLGRFFCGWMCPVGSLIDLLNKFIGNKKSEKNFQIKEITFIFILFAFLVNTGTFLYLITPFGFLPHLKSASLTGFTLLSFPLLYSIRKRRGFCRDICPLGGLLSIIAELGLMKKKVKGECGECALCAEKCRMNAIPIQNPSTTYMKDCILCMDCVYLCPSSNVSFNILPPSPPSVERRRILSGIIAGGAGLSLYLMKKENLLRPPGSVKNGFTARCIRCGNCRSVCPTNVIGERISFSPADFMTPYMRDGKGYCIVECVKCTEVCPTGAIKKLTIEEKRKTVIGTAVIISERCLATSGKSECTLCYISCPYFAIELKEGKTFREPFVINERCTGCLICSYRCPANAIYIKPIP